MFILQFIGNGNNNYKTEKHTCGGTTVFFFYPLAARLATAVIHDHHYDLQFLLFFCLLVCFTTTECVEIFVVIKDIKSTKNTTKVKYTKNEPPPPIKRRPTYIYI